MRQRVRSLLQGGFVFFLAIFATSVSSFVFHVIFSRLLGPSRYGALGALLNLLLLLAVPLAAIQAVVTQTESSRRSLGGYGIGVRPVILRALVVGTVAMGVLMAVSPLVSSYLHFSSDWPILVLSSWAVPSTVGAVLQGILMGRLQFAAASLAAVCGQVFGRLILGVLLFEVGLGFESAVIASVASQFVSTAILFIPLSSEFHQEKTQLTGIDLRSGYLPLLALVGYWIIGTEDTILARHFLSSHAAGLYAAASTAGGIALFVPGPIAVIVFPKLSRHHGRGDLALTILKRSLGITALLGVASAIVIATAPSFILKVLFGQGYLEAANTVWILGFESAVLGIIGVLIYFHLARTSLGSLYAWFGAFIAFLGIEVFHNTRVEIADVMLGSAAVTLFILIASAILAVLRDKRADENPAVSGSLSFDSGVD